MINTALLLLGAACVILCLLLFISNLRLQKTVRHMKDRNEYQITINKWNLVNTRLQMLLHQQYAVNNEDYENATTLAKSIALINTLLTDD